MSTYIETSVCSLCGSKKYNSICTNPGCLLHRDSDDHGMDIM